MCTSQCVIMSNPTRSIKRKQQSPHNLKLQRNFFFLIIPHNLWLAVSHCRNANPHFFMLTTLYPKFFKKNRTFESRWCGFSQFINGERPRWKSYLVGFCYPSHIPQKVFKICTHRRILPKTRTIFIHYTHNIEKIRLKIRKYSWSSIYITGEFFLRSGVTFSW